MWLELTSEDEEKIYVNLGQVIAIRQAAENKHTRLVTAGGEIVIKEPIAYIQSQVDL
ncbi:hypothetical protein [Pararhizobium sp. O133]|uniref:hypothetical protein n=1 Tax=Pararhizobium sp. O133 TaxID=3449278 RepID=UPI003F68318F